jgi:hypothetical protein
MGHLAGGGSDGEGADAPEIDRAGYGRRGEVAERGQAAHEHGPHEVAGHEDLGVGQLVATERPSLGRLTSLDIAKGREVLGDGCLAESGSRASSFTSSGPSPGWTRSETVDAQRAEHRRLMTSIR